MFFFFQAEDGIRDLVRSRGLGDVYKRQPGRSYRNPVNVPDDLERAALEAFIQAGSAENKPRTAFANMGKQPVYRYMEPIRLLEPCLPCHGKPKGEPDMLGFHKDGLVAGDVIGLMSVTLAVSD